LARCRFLGKEAKFTRQFIENAIGHSIEEIVDVMRGFRSYLLECTDEARGLMASIPIRSG
jgi:hypothetical protein